VSGEMLSAALGYAARGWPVVPLHTPVDGRCSCHGASSCNSPGKHPRTKNGLKDASVAALQIQEWWSKWPEANIGIPTGSISGLLVVDVDNKNGKCGGDNLVALAAGHGGMPSTLTAATGSGEHLFYIYPGMVVKNSAGKLADGVDVRGDGGYVVAAPSLYANGTRYAWREPNRALAEVPAWLMNRMTASNKRTTKMQDMGCKDYTDAPAVTEGTRNDKLYKLGCALRGQHGMDHDRIAASLLEFNQAKCEPPLEEPEVVAIVESVCKFPPEISTNKSGKRLEESPLYWFQFNTRTWFADQNIAMMNAEQTGWHIRLKAFAWDGCGLLPADPGKLWKLAKARSRKVFERDCELVLADYEQVEVDGVAMLKNSKMAADYANILENWMKKKEAGEASKAARLTALQQKQEAAQPTPAQLLAA
jgi:hypothetical protein